MCSISQSLRHSIHICRFPRIPWWSTNCIGFIPLKPKVVMMLTLSSLVAPRGATSDDKVGIMTTPGFQWPWVVLSVPGPRQQLNQITSYLDASHIYASTAEEALQIRDNLRSSKCHLHSHRPWFDVIETGELSWCQLCHHWWHIRMSFTTTYGGVSDDKVGIMATPSFHWWNN